MESNSVNIQLKNIEQKKNGKKQLPNNNKNSISKYKSQKESIPENIPNKFISFLTSKTGIIIIISTSLAIIIAVVLGLVLGRHDDISSEKKDEQENQDSDTTEVENHKK